MDFEVLDKAMPVIRTNFDDVKNALSERLKDYEGIVVTEDTLSSCKDMQKELAHLRIEVDNNRKAIKADLSAPIVEFENKCKELVTMIEKVEAPIKDGIKVFDDAKRDEKRKKAEEILAEVAGEAGLNEEFLPKLTVLDKYLNLTASEKSVREDIEVRANALRIEQDRKQERCDTIQSIIDTENQRLTAKMCLRDFGYMINAEYPLADIIAQIKRKAEEIYGYENKPAVEEVKQEEPKVEEKKPEIKKEPEKIYEATYTVVADASTLKMLSDFLKAHGVSYKVSAREV